MVFGPNIVLIGLAYVGILHLLAWLIWETRWFLAEVRQPQKPRRRRHQR